MEFEPTLLGKDGDIHIAVVNHKFRFKVSSKYEYQIKVHDQSGEESDADISPDSITFHHVTKGKSYNLVEIILPDNLIRFKVRVISPHMAVHILRQK